MAIDPAAPRSRRAILGAALGGAGALFAGALGRAAPVAAANGDGVLLGEGTTATDNAATAATIVKSTGADALGGVSDSGTGVHGHSTGPGTDVPTHSTGVIGTTGDTTGVDENTDETGVYGFSDVSQYSTGVWGDTFQGIGVVGRGDWGVYGTGASTGVIGDVDSVSQGVYGFSGDEPIVAPGGSAGVMGQGGAGGGIGVRGHAGPGGSYGMVASASSTSQFALYVAGKLRLSRSGRTAIASTASSKKILLAGVTTGSWIIATLQTSVSGCYVRAVVPTTGAFTIVLSKAPGKTVVVGWVVVN